MGVVLPDVDFEEHVAVGVFVGEQSGDSAVGFRKPRDKDDELYIPYQISHPDVQISSGAVTAAPSHPYVLSLLTRTDKKIRLTQREANP